MASEIRNRFTDTEMQIARETDLPELLSHLGYQVKRVGRLHTTAEMDSLRIKDRCTRFRYSQNTGGDAITFLQQFCGKSFPEAVEYLLTFHGKARDAPVPQPKPVSQKQEFSLPPRNADDRRVFAYLRKCGIAARVIRQFMNAGLLYEDAMANWLLNTSEKWLRPVYDTLREQLRKETVLHADETTLQVLKEAGRPSTSKSYVWLYRTSGCAEQAIVLYEYQSTRKAEHAEAFLQGFNG